MALFATLLILVHKSDTLLSLLFVIFMISYDQIDTVFCALAVNQ